MTIAELLLRIGCAIVAWLMMYTHTLWLAIVDDVGCGPDGDALYRLLLGLTLITLPFCFLLGLSRKVGSIHDTLRWGCAPLLLLVPLAANAVWPVLNASTLGDAPLCPGPVSAWHPWWAPLQLAVLAVVSLMAYRAWRR